MESECEPDNRDERSCGIAKHNQSVTTNRRASMLLATTVVMAMKIMAILCNLVVRLYRFLRLGQLDRNGPSIFAGPWSLAMGSV